MKFFNRFRGQVAVLMTILAIVMVSLVVAQVTTFLPTPAAWTDNTGTNYFGLNGSAVPFVQQGTNVYTGVTTNRAFLGGTGVTNTLVIKNGIITQIQ